MKHLDWDESLRLSNYNEILAKELLSLLKADLQTFTAQMRKAITANDKITLHRLIHKLHGACCYCGVPTLRQLLGQLESVIKHKEVDQLNDLTNKIEREIKQIQKSLEEYP